MNKTEKRILFVAFIVYLLAFVDFGAVEFVYNSFFWLTNVVLAFMYFFGGYFLFKLPKKYVLLSVFSGIAFALSFIANIFGFRIIRDDQLISMLPVPNLLLFLILLITFVVFKVKAKDFIDFKLLFIRSLFLVIITSFFTYMPISSKFYRAIMYGLHNGNKEMQYHLKAHGYVFEFEEYYEKGNCDKAIEAAEKGLEFAIKWLDRDYEYFDQQIKDFIQVNDFSDKAKKEFRYSIGWLLDSGEFHKIDILITKVFEAYRCKAYNEYKIQNYQEAISNYQRALIFLDIYENDSDYWKSQRIYVYDDMAVSYGKTGEFEIADSLFHLAFSDFNKIEYPNKHEFYTGKILKNWSVLYADFQDYSTSNVLLLQALDFYEKYPEDEEYLSSVYLAREQFIMNYTAIGDYKQIKFHLDKAFSIFEGVKINEKGQDFAYKKLMFFKGMYCYITESYSESIEILNENANNLNSEYDKSNTIKLAHYFYLSLSYLAVSDFENTEKFIEKGLELTLKNSKTEADFLSLYANLNVIKSNYKKAKESYQKSLLIYENLKEEGDIVSILFALSELELTISDFEKAKQYFDRGTKLYYESDYEFSFRNASIHNLFAHLNYNINNNSVSDTIYNRVLESNKKTDQENSISSAVAYNGLGLVKLSTKIFFESEELFKKSIKIYEEHFKGENHFLGVVYLNYTNVLIQTNQLEKAEEYLSKSEKIFKKYFDASHDNFGDLYLVYGDFYKKKKENVLSKQNYEKALKIFLNKFDENHNKVKLVRQKIK